MGIESDNKSDDDERHDKNINSRDEVDMSDSNRVKAKQRNYKHLMK